jgi:hypothetical protein
MSRIDIFFYYKSIFLKNSELTLLPFSFPLFLCLSCLNRALSLKEAVAAEKRRTLERMFEARKAKRETLKLLREETHGDSSDEYQSMFKRIQPFWEIQSKSSFEQATNEEKKSTSFADLIDDFAKERQKATTFETELSHAILLRDLASTIYQLPSNELAKIATFHSSSVTVHNDAKSSKGTTEETEEDDFWKLFAEVKETALGAREADARIEQLVGYSLDI